MVRRTEDLRITRTRPMIPPAILHEELPITEKVSEVVASARDHISNILQGTDPRVLVIVGPCSIHDPESAIEYAERLCELRDKLSDKLFVVMRAYFEKPRTTVGWKGFINDPNLDESFEINKGLRLARKLLIDLNELGMPTGSEFLDLQIPQHIADITAWVAIGARTTESQVHRELASGLSMPVGFKNTTEGTLQPAVDAVRAARTPHWFPSVTKEAVSAIFQTSGNPDCHVILRGGSRTGPNYDAESVGKAAERLREEGLPARLMVDCSHGNSRKDFRKQAEVLAEIRSQIQSGSESIMGIMLESNLVEGRQDVVAGQSLIYGQSITDSCISFEETDRILSEFAQAI